MNLTKIDLAAIYPRCRMLIGPDIWQQIISSHDLDHNPENFPEVIVSYNLYSHLPEFLPELAHLEWSVSQVEEKSISIPGDQEDNAINPTLLLRELQWKNLANDVGSPSAQAPEPGKEYILIWKHPEDGEVHMKVASPEDLLILKMISESIDRKEVAQIGAISTFVVDAAVDRAIDRGIIIAPPSRIRRDFDIIEASPYAKKHFLISPSFTLQWHITQVCDLHCKHCYDRSDRSALTLEPALKIIDDLDTFCRERHVKGQISFTGGNPLLHPDFLSIYQTASDRGFTLFILGNPTTREQIETILSIQQPDFFQVSLEGLPEYNDFIRGHGHFEKTMRFLEILRELGVYSMVMLTLTNENIHQVLPLAELLHGKADVFFFNRLSKVGQGESLELPPRQDYISFLERYVEARDKNPVLGLKDNLINVLNYQKGSGPFGGCTGFGCGAAFNFVAVLADGEVHACRKFPSPIGNILYQRIAEIYDSKIAQRYRSGCAECRLCLLRPVCGGCLASAYSYGLDVFEKKDPYCFL
jgi:selenobiotic family peptide radical SAM maturase